MNTTDYGKTAARRYLKAWAEQNATRWTVGCPMTRAEQMLGNYVHMARLEGLPCPEYGNTGNRQDDVAVLAASILANWN